MPEESRTRRFAILIDADNTSPRIAAGLFEEVAKFGEASVRRIYGDFSGQRLKSWADILQKYSGLVLEAQPPTQPHSRRSIPTSSFPTRLERTRPASPW